MYVCVSWGGGSSPVASTAAYTSAKDGLLIQEVNPSPAREETQTQSVRPSTSLSTAHKTATPLIKQGFLTAPRKETLYPEGGSSEGSAPGEREAGGGTLAARGP